jgi:acyl-CoA dehydrogenase
MDFSFTEEQEALRELARRIFADRATVERVSAVEGSADRFDRELWSALARADLLGAVLPAGDGGGGCGEIELCLLLEEQGRVVAPVPLLATAVSAMTIGAFGDEPLRAEWLPRVASGEAVLTAALAEAGAADPLVPQAAAEEGAGGWRVSGRKLSVPAAHVAAGVLVPAGDGLFLVDPAGPGVEAEVAEATDRSLVGHLTFVRAPARRVGDRRAVRHLVERWLVGLCALQVGVCEAALAMAASYTSTRHQFGKPLSSFQGVALKAADAYIDTEAMRVTMWQAAWRLATGGDAWGDVLVAKWWAAEAGQRVVHTVQHLHGGVGADVSYPVHRYFLWGKQIEDTLGGASQTLARLGAVIREGLPCR